MVSSTSTGIRGDEGIVLSFQIGAGPAVTFDGDAKEVNLTGEDADDSDLTFLEASTGGAQADTLTVKGIQSTKAGSLWRFLWDNPGTEIAVVYGPHGNAAPSADEPHFIMTCKTGRRPDIGGAAQRAKTRYDFEAALEVIDGPTLDDGA